MKKLRTYKLLLLTLFLFSSSALAHTGHLSSESVHGFLHIEHIIMLAAAGLTAYLAKVL